MRRVKLRQRTWENASKCQNPRTVSKKTSFEKSEIATTYVGKRKQAQKPTYAEQKVVSRKYRKQLLRRNINKIQVIADIKG